MFMLKILGWLTGGGVTGILNAVLGHIQKAADVELSAFNTGTAADTARQVAYLNFMLENNRLKLAQQGWWGARCIILLAGIPASAHFAAVFLDTLIPPFGSWGIPKLPAPYDMYQWAIVQSFFLVMPAMPIASAFAGWLARKR
jgi:hypothetical protein